MYIKRRYTKIYKEGYPPVYYEGIEGNVGKAVERKNRWETLRNNFQNFYNYSEQLISRIPTPEPTPEPTPTPTPPPSPPPEPEPDTNRTEVSVEMIDAAELEIYEPENVYQVHYATEEEGVVVGLSVNGKMMSGVDNTVEFVQFFLKEIQGDVENYLHNKISKMEIDEFAAYVRPENSVNVSVDDRDKLIEYSQMMNTIQGQRDYIQKSGRSKSMFLLKFMQNAKGTYFEILGGEKDNYLAEEKVYGYYLSKGYGAGPNGSEGGDTDGSGSGSGSTGTCRYKSSRGNKRRREGISAIPSLNKYGNRFRITRMKEFYSQEPLDWRNDNYYSNQIYTLNADNLNVMIDPEFADKERVIVTKPSSNGSSEEMLQNTQEIRSEQEMLGFYRIKCTLSK